MKPLIIIRPQPGCDASVAEAQALGLDVRGFPLSEIRPLPWDMPDRAEVDALLVGSANAIRHGGAALAALRGKPVYAVGQKTADAAKAAGFDVAETGSGGLQQVIERVHSEHRRLLRLAGQDRVELDVPEGVTLTERRVYAVVPRTMPDALADLLRKPAVIALHSGAAARQFAANCEARGIDRGILEIAAIGPRVAEMAGDGWGALRIAERPQDRPLLALAKQMCQEPARKRDYRHEAMQDTAATMPAPAQLPAPVQTPAPARPRRTARGQIVVALLAFMLGAAVVGWLGWRGHLAPMISDSPHAAPRATLTREIQPGPKTQANEVSPMSDEEQVRSFGTVEGRLAMLEDRLSRLNLQANAASGNAARAESLLIAFATRRMVDRGEPLRYLSNQLRLRFANAQPKAVETILAFSEKPVTIDELSARLEALAPELTGTKEEDSFWNRARREMSAIFTVRRASSELRTPEARIERARVMLTARRIPEAIAQVERLPGAVAAEKWIADARRFAEVQKALDLIETAAMLEPRRLQDSEGNRIDQPSPLATPPTEMEADEQR